MLTTLSKKDICSTCNFSLDCIIPSSNSRKPIIYCEQFDNNIAIRPKPVSRAVKQRRVPKIEEEFELKGLCVNCENRLDCLTARREGGVWHCEEYC